MSRLSSFIIIYNISRQNTYCSSQQWLGFKPLEPNQTSTNKPLEKSYKKKWIPHHSHTPKEQKTLSTNPSGFKV